MGRKRRVLEYGENLCIVQCTLVRKCPYTAQYCAQLNENQIKYTDKKVLVEHCMMNTVNAYNQIK